MKDDATIIKDGVLKGMIEKKLHILTPYQKELGEQVRVQPIRILEAEASLGKKVGTNMPPSHPDVQRVSLEDQVLTAKLRARFARNVERAALWHLIHALTPEYRENPADTLLLPDEHKKGPASAAALVHYARSSGIGIRSLERLTALVLRLTREKTAQDVKRAISDVTEMGHSNQVRCLTRAAYRTETVVADLV
jgi:hypothetical protein